MKRPIDAPLPEIAAEAQRVRDTHPGALTWQKWTCAHCGDRQRMEAANTFYDSGRCEACGKVTQIERCGFALLMPSTAEGAAVIGHMARKSDN